MKNLYQTFLKGAVAILPLAVTVYLIVWLVAALEGGMGSVVRLVIDEENYVPGLGLVLGIVLVFALGVLLQMYLMRRVWAGFDALLDKLPLIKTIYGSVKDMLGLLKGDASEAKQVVLVRLGDPPAKILGFVTRDHFSDLPEGMGDADTIAVYLPMSYQLGGFTVMVKKADVEPIDMTVEEALRFSVTAGATTKAPQQPVEQIEQPVERGQGI